MSSQEINYIKEQSQKGESKEKKALYGQALKFLNSPKIKNLSHDEYEKKVKEIFDILKNKEKDLLKQQTSNKIDFLKLSMEVENQKKERMFKNLEQEINMTLGSLREFNETKNQTNIAVRGLESGFSKVASNFGYQGVGETLEAQYIKRKEYTLKAYQGYKKKIEKGEIKLNKQEREDFNKLEQSIIAIGTTEFKMVGRTEKEKKKNAINPEKKAGKKHHELNIFLSEKGIKYEEIKGKMSKDIIPLLKSKKLNQDEINYVLQNYGGAKKEAKIEAGQKIKDKTQLAEAEKLISQGLTFNEAKEEINKKKAKTLVNKSKQDEEQEYIPQKIVPKKIENKDSISKNNEQSKTDLSPVIETQISSTKPLDLGIISSLNKEDRRKAFDLVFENIDKNPGHTKKLITNGIEFNLSGTKGNYEVRYGDRIITGLSREKVKESISFATFTAEIGLQCLIPFSSKIINKINEKEKLIEDNDGLNPKEKNIILQKLGRAILGDKYNQKVLLSENIIQFKNEDSKKTFQKLGTKIHNDKYIDVLLEKIG